MLVLLYVVFKGGFVIIFGFFLFVLIYWYIGKVMIDCIYDVDNCVEFVEYKIIVGYDKK